MKTVSRYDFNGLYNPLAEDFLQEHTGADTDAPEFLEQVAKRLERLLPNSPHIENLCREIRAFATGIACEYSESFGPDPRMAEIVGMGEFPEN